MSVKADTLLKKVTSFERLALYSDRQAYLVALAQASLPDTKALINTIDAVRMNAVKAINTFWRQNTDFPLAAREAYSALAYPQTDLATAQGEQLTSAMDQFVTALNGVYRALANSGEQKFLQFSQQTVYPALENLQAQVTKFKSAQESFPQSSEEDNINQLPEQTIKGYVPIPKDVQESLNKLLGLQIKVDGELGHETRNAINKFKTEYNMSNGSTDQDVINLVRSTISRNKT